MVLLYNCYFMRISSCVLLCLLSASLVSSIAILDVPEYELDTDIVAAASDYSGRHLHRFLPKVVHRIFRSPPAPPPAPKPAPKATPAPAPKATPAPAPKATPAPAPKISIKLSVPAPKTASAPTPAPVVKVPVVTPTVVAVKSAPALAAAPVVVAAPAPTPTPAAALPIYFTCDNEFDMYVNGDKVGRGTSWTTTYHFAPLVKPGDVIAIDGVDQGGPAAFIGVFGGKVTKPSEWRCSTKESTGWTKNIFDDSAWTKPVSYGRNQDNNIWRSVGGGSRPNIPGDAEWLWTSDNNNHNRVFCRYFPVAPTPAPVVVVAAAAPKAATPAPVVVVSPTPAPKQTAIDEIIATNKKTDAKLTKFQEKLLSLMKETTDDQVKVETENRNNFNGVSVTLQNEQLRLESSRQAMKKLYDETDRLNTTIQAHYKKLIADTKYLETLDAMRPGFLKSLDDIATHIQAVKTTVDNKIVKDEYKDEMIRLLTGIHFNTHNISGYIASAFINHYNKYKNLIQKENTDYSSEMKRLTLLSNDYKVQVQKTADIEKERVRLQDILVKLKDTLSVSVTQREEFDLLVKEVISIFDRKRC